MKFVIIICLFLIDAHPSFSGVAKRITEISFNLNEVYRLRLYPGRPSLIEFPCDIKFALPGNKEEIAVTVGVDNKNQLILTVSSFKVRPTNLIVHCGSDNYVFDITPSVKSHRDFIKISYAHRGKSGKKYKLVSSNSMRSSKKYKKRKLISSSSRRKR